MTILTMRIEESFSFLSLLLTCVTVGFICFKSLAKLLELGKSRANLEGKLPQALIYPFPVHNIHNMLEDTGKIKL